MSLKNHGSTVVYTTPKQEESLANVTVKVDDELLAKARWLAAQHKTSLNAIVKQKIEEFVATDLRRESAIRGLEELYRRSRARVGKHTWSRDEIHER